jgi:DNA-directed RNA polymerase subunit RPC12/RpoP
MSILRGVGGSGDSTVGLGAKFIPAQIEERRSARSDVLCAATLACARCDAPISTGSRGLSITEHLVCPFCDHRAPVRDFLSLAVPTRPARVVVRLRRPGLSDPR